VGEWTKTPCDEYLGCRNEHGYGKATRGGRSVLTHRLAWEEAHGPVPPGRRVLHHCDNPPCRNVLHLFLGTQADNVADMDAKGRRKWKTSPGERNGNVTLSREMVDAIRGKYRKGVTRQVDLAAEFGISQSQVSNIVRGALWRQTV
jgi:predicted XRE-type DNA-binding protein